MSVEQRKTILYLGRPSATAETLRGLLIQVYGDGQEQLAPTMEVVTSQKNALRTIHAQPPVLILVETTGKADSRLRFCQTVRLRLPSAPIVAIGAQRADRYVFDFDALVSTPIEPRQALGALHQIAASSAAASLARGPIRLNTATRTVSTPQGDFELTPKLCTLLQLLMERAGHVVQRSEIMQHVWETSFLEDTRTLDVHIRWLRKMIEPEPASPLYLQTRRGQGYILQVDGG